LLLLSPGYKHHVNLNYNLFKPKNMKIAVLCRGEECKVVSEVTESTDNIVLTLHDEMKYYTCLSTNNICTSVTWDLINKFQQRYINKFQQR